MNKIVLGLGLFIALFTTTNLRAQTDYNNDYGPPQDGDEVTYQDFYDDLQPYGRWVDYPSYGYVWVPTMNSDFSPYNTNGHWVYSTMGWTWASDYEWGWAPFHYGRWFQDANYGWAWMPGYEWAPAWVSWRESNDYYGWAPLQPNYSVGISVNIGNISISAWNFLPRQYINQPNFRAYCLDRGRNVTVFNNTTIINNYNRGNYGGNRQFNYYSGPNSRDVERYTRQPVRTYSFENSGRRGADRISGDRLSIYRPRVNDNRNDRGFAPQNFERNGQTITRGNNNPSRNDRPNVGTNNSNNWNTDNRPNNTVRPVNNGNVSNSNRTNGHTSWNNSNQGGSNGRPADTRTPDRWNQGQTRPSNNVPQPQQPANNSNNNNGWGRDRGSNRPETVNQQPRNSFPTTRPERQPQVESPTQTRPQWQNNSSQNNSQPRTASPRVYNNDRPQMNQNSQPRSENRGNPGGNRGGRRG